MSVEEANLWHTRWTQWIILPQTLRLAMACNDASDASTLIAMQSCYHPVVGRSQTKGERRKLGEREAWSCLREVLHRVLYPNTHTDGFKKKRSLHSQKGRCVHTPSLCHDLCDDSFQGIGYSFDKPCGCGRLSHQQIWLGITSAHERL